MTRLPPLFALLCILCGQLSAAVFPPVGGIVDVRERYGAKGDGVTDDTEALQRALNENVGRHRLLYFSPR